MMKVSNRKIQRVISSLFVMLCFCSLPVHAKYGGGSGEPNDPYLIYTAEQMNEIGLYEDDWDKHFKLMSDIDLSAYKGTAFHIIGRFTPGSGPVGGRGRGGTGGDPDEWKPFTGVFDGNDHVISDFTYDCNGISIVALFRCVGGSFAEIRDLGLIDPNVHAEAGNEVGSLVGRLMGGGTVVGCYVEGGRIEGSWSNGGLVGCNYQGMIKACHSTAIVSGNLSVGGIVGYNLEGTITHCYSRGNVWGDKQIGGLVGSNEGGKISVCCFSGPASGSYEVGGLVGENESGTITQCYSSGTVWGSEYIGGLVGSNYGWVNTSTASPDAILNCYSSSSVSGDDMVGGLVGAIMISCPAIGYPPGLPAFYESGPVTIRNSYATGSVVGDGTVGGLVGEGGAVCYCFWDTQTSGQTTSARGEGKTTTEMQTASTFFGWGGCGDEPIWTIDEGNDYPRLYWENKSGEILTMLPLSGLLLGSGIRDDPYLIHTPEELNLVAAALCEWDKCFRLMADIDLSDFSYEAALIAPDRDKMALGFQGTPFSGVFDGNGHTISHLTIDGVSHIGLFGQLGSGAKITNLGLEAVDVNGGGDYVGGLVGQNFYDGSITTCYSAGTVSGGSFWIGGLVGYNNGSITTCYSTGTVRGERSYVGGLVGVNNGSIATSYSAGSVTGNSDVGGLVGFNRDSITTSYSTTAVTGDSSLGGLVGYNSGTVAMSYGIGPVTGNEEVGGLVGDDEGKILTRPGSMGNTTSSFWNMETSSQTESAGGEGKTTTEMQTASTFLDAGWDFMFEANNGTNDIWWILEGQSYPRLWWQYSRAFSPYPQDGAVDVPQPLILSWLPGGSGLYHDVYIGEDREAVANATIESPEIYRGRQEPEITTYYLDTLKLEETYYWRIDEVNDADPNSLPKGNVWSFTTANFIIVDDFESYSADNPLSDYWNGWHYNPWPPEPVPYFTSNVNVAPVGFGPTNSGCEEVIVHGGNQSMPFAYDNNKTGYAKYSETELTLVAPRDWKKEGITELSLWFRGHPASVGSFVEEPVGTYTMTGSGTDIGEQYDQFHYAFKTLSGPGMIVAKIESIENTHEWAKAGVMIREVLEGESTHVFVYLTPSNEIAFQVRAEWRQTSFTTNKTGITTPRWMKLERSTTGYFTASHSVNGTAWQPVQNSVPMNISMSSHVYIGLAVTAHDANATCQAVFSNVTITGMISTQWEHQDIGITYNDAEPLCVAVSNVVGPPAVVVHDDPSAAQIDTWTEWIIPLSAFADQGIYLKNVDRLAIGLGIMGNVRIPGGSGKMYFDDIRLYRPRQAMSNDLEVNVP